MITSGGSDSRTNLETNTRLLSITLEVDNSTELSLPNLLLKTMTDSAPISS